MFISDADLSTLLNETVLAQVITITASNRRRAEQFAIEEAKSYLNFRYDTAAIFDFEVFDYDQTASYTPDLIIIDHDATAYTCIAPAPAATPLVDTQYFKAEDGRSSLMVMIVTDLLAYHLLSTLGANRMTQHVKDRYENAINKLKAIRHQKMNPVLPLLAIDDSTPATHKTSTMSIYSRPKRNNYY